MFDATTTLGSALLVTLLGVFVAYQSYHEIIRCWFLAFCLALSFWQVAYWLSNLQTQQALLFNRLTFAAPLIAETCFLIFSRYLYSSQSEVVQRRQSKYVLAGSLFGFSGAIASLLPNGVVHDIYPQLVNGVFAGYNVHHGELYYLFVLSFLVLAISITKLLIGLRRARDAVTRQRGKIIAIGVGLALSMGLCTNIILPLVLKSSSLSYLGSLTVIMLVGVLSLAIARYKLIDVRIVVARSLAYTLFVATLASIYGLTVFVIATFIFQVHFSTQTLIILALPAALIGLTFGGIKNTFTRKTDRLFFQDLYDPQTFLDQLNKALVGNIELEKLLETCAQIIASNLGAEYCLFGIRETESKGIRIIGTTKKSFRVKDIAEARHTSPLVGADVIITDFLPDEFSRFKRLLLHNEIAVLARLVPEANSAHGGEGFGYIILGHKRSGNTYTAQDLRILSIIANELVIAIQNALRFEQIQRFNLTLQEEVDNATAKLRRTNKRLEELDSIKDDFISMASHQLRTPLTSVKGYLSMVLEGDAGPLNDVQTQMLKQAFTSSQRMVFLITDLLNVSRLKTGKFVIEPTSVSLDDVVGQELDQLTETAALKNIELKYEKPADFPQLMLDEVKIRQVVMNFVDNAIYYTPQGGHIRVELKEKLSTVELRVIDDGIGVPRSEQHHLFTKFYRATNARKARPDGTGLGLFMAQKVITAQGGTIIFSSQEGKGSTFGFTFTKSRVAVPNPAKPAAAAPAKEVKAAKAA